MTERSKARVYSRSLAGIVSSNPAGGMDAFLLSVLVVSGRGPYNGPIPRPEES